MSVMQKNRTKQLLQSGETALGCVVQQLGSPDVPAILAAGGFDYAFIDLEHGCIDLQTAQGLIRSCLGTGITPIVRVSELLYSLVARVLDAGAQGIILPRVEDPRKLEEAVAWTQYPPVGVRGFGITPVQLGYRPHSFSEIITHVNSNVLLVMQIESQLAVDRAQELLDVAGVDVALIGPADLSIALGVPGELENPKLLRAVDRCLNVCAKNGVAPGIQVRDIESASRWIQRGMRFVGCGTEHILLLDRATEVARGLRSVTATQSRQEAAALSQ
jgi:2-dehydro-3-deoxyglucarate aldolase/4-hydroxy-2-oxoheptanedioate aldolase